MLTPVRVIFHCVEQDGYEWLFAVATGAGSLLVALATKLATWCAFAPLFFLLLAIWVTAPATKEALVECLLGCLTRHRAGSLLVALATKLATWCAPLFSSIFSSGHVGRCSCNKRGLCKVLAWLLHETCVSMSMQSFGQSRTGFVNA